MHELGITEEIVDLITVRAGGARVKRVVIEIGKLSAVLPEAVRFCFDLCAEGTAAQGARLVILEPPGRARCRACGLVMELEQMFGRCQCGGSDLEWLSGEELKIKEIEVESCAQTADVRTRMEY